LPDGPFKLIARVAVWPWLALVLICLVTTAAMVARLNMPDPGFRLAGGCVAGGLASGYLAVGTLRLCLARGALVFVHGDHLVDTLSLSRRWRIDEIVSVDLAPSPVIVGRRDQVVLTLKSGRTETLSALCSFDPAAEILGRLKASLDR
jgi:hypothetical protein